MSDESIKDAIRTRDRMRCRDCGMTNEEHIRQTERCLEVHRLLPGAIYHPLSCVTLCRPCHAKKPKKMAQAFFASLEEQLEDGMALPLWLNTYIAEERRLFLSLSTAAEQAEVSTRDLIVEILMKHFDQMPPDYCI